MPIVLSTDRRYFLKSGPRREELFDCLRHTHVSRELSGITSFSLEVYPSADGYMIDVLDVRVEGIHAHPKDDRWWFVFGRVTNSTATETLYPGTSWSRSVKTWDAGNGRYFLAKYNSSDRKGTVVFGARSFFDIPQHLLLAVEQSPQASE